MLKFVSRGDAGSVQAQTQLIHIQPQPVLTHTQYSRLQQILTQTQDWQLQQILTQTQYSCHQQVLTQVKYRQPQPVLAQPDMCSQHQIQAAQNLIEQLLLHQVTQQIGPQS
jgi:hypothetical protein